MQFKKIALFLSLSALALPVIAQGFVPDGYVRMRNVATGRYVRVVDNRGSIDIRRTSADLSALRTILYYDNVVSDPSSLLYLVYRRSDTTYINKGGVRQIKEISQTYNIMAQGTDMYSIIGVGLRVCRSGSYYRAFQEESGIRVYLNDSWIPASGKIGPDDIEGYVLDNDETKREWAVCQVNSSDDDSYFGITPTLSIDGKFYYPLFFGFPFTFHSQGMKAYYVKQIDTENGICVTEELKGTIPASTPVIIECQSPNAGDNRLQLLAPGSGNPLTGNRLSGAMFKNDYAAATGHRNRVDYDASTMRILGVTDKGKLGFVTAPASYDAIDGNSAYLKAQSLPAQLVLMNQGEYDEFLIEAGVDSPKSDTGIVAWTLDGTPIEAGSLEELQRGIYIVDGHKYIVR